MLPLEKVGELAVYLAQGGKVEQALALTETLLATLSDRQTAFNRWTYEELLNRLLPVLVSQSGMTILKLLCHRLSDILASSEEHNQQVEIPSYLWRPAIENHKQ